MTADFDLSWCAHKQKCVVAPINYREVSTIVLTGHLVKVNFIDA